MHPEIGLIGLGKMGFNLALNLKRNNFKVTAHDISVPVVEQMKREGIDAFYSLKDAMENLNGRKIIWMMVPSGKIVDDTIDSLLEFLEAGDILIDGGNSNYRDSIRRYEMLSGKGVEYLDCGSSGGTSGALNGICAMVGGKKEVFDSCEPLFKAISVENGYLYCGASGSGHFTKMVHNGIEYGMMQSIAEGFELMEKSDYDFDFKAVANMFNHGSVIRGWLMELTQNAFDKDARLSSIKGIMHSSGEGKWMLESALDMQVATPVIALSLLMRYRSQQEDTFSGKVVAALRNEFGGHAVEKAE